MPLSSPSDPPLTFGAWLKRQRRLQDLTRDALAAQVHCSSQMIKLVEADERKPSKELAGLLAHTLAIAPALRASFVDFARGLANDFQKPVNDATSSTHVGVPGMNGRSSLPSPMTSLIGREAELAAGCALLTRTHVRLVTLFGPPGTGKTRLGIDIARAMQDQFRDGVSFVSLAGVDTAAQVPTSIANALLTMDFGSKSQLHSPMDQLKDALRDRNMLLVLDNFEQVVDAGQLVVELLMHAPGLKALVSSRELLQVYGEHAFAVSTLAAPDPNHVPPLELLAGYTAVALFVERALAAQPAFLLTQSNARDVARICNLVDGLPLAIEMAAAQLRQMGVNSLAERLTRHLTSLGLPARDFTPRQQTLRGAIDWSYRLLNEQERQAFEILSVFPAGFDADAAAALTKIVIADAADAAWVEAMLHTLFNKSLLAMSSYDAQQTPRYSMLETIREYGREKLQASGRLAEMQINHAQHYLMVLRQAQDVLYTRAHKHCMDRLMLELANLEVAFGFLLRVDATAAVDFALEASSFHFLRGAWTVEKRWFDQALAAAPLPDSASALSVRAIAIARCGFVTLQLGQIELAEQLNQEAMRVAEKSTDAIAVFHALRYSALILRARNLNDEAIAVGMRCIAIAESLGRHGYTGQMHENIGRIHLDRNEFELAQLHFSHSLRFRRETNDCVGEVRALLVMGEVAYRQQNFQRAEELLVQVVGMQRELGERYSLSLALEVLGAIYRQEQRYSEAEACLVESVALAHAMYYKSGHARSLEAKAALSFDTGQIKLAQTEWRAALRDAAELGEFRTIAYCLEGLATTTTLTSDAHLGVRILAAVYTLRREQGIQLPPSEVTTHAQQMAALRASMADAVFETLWFSGLDVPLQTAIALAGEIAQSKSE